MDETMDVEIQPANSTFTAPEVGIYGLLVGSLAEIVVWGGGPWVVLANCFYAIACAIAFRLAYLYTHQPVATNAWLEESQLIVRDPNPWWKRLAPFEGPHLSLDVRSIEEDEGELLLRGVTDGDLGTGQKYSVWLRKQEKTRERLSSSMPEMTSRNV